jgi:hypothetical protein
MYSVALFVITIYCLIEDELYPYYCQLHGTPRSAGFAPALSDGECLTLEIVGNYLGYTTQKQLFEQMLDRFGTWFPGLHDRVAFTRQSANLWQVKTWMHQQIVERLGGHQAALQVIDTMPLPICKVARRFQRRIFRRESVLEGPPPTKGYCAAKDEDYFGFKGGLRITDYGLIVHAPILQAYGHDSTCRDALLAGVEPDTQVVGDSAFLDLERQQELNQVYQIHLLTPLKSNMQPTPERQPFVLPGWTRSIRRLVETVYAQLVERFHIQALKVRDAWHLNNLWVTKILAHSICVWLNLRAHRNPLDFDGLVEFEKA